MSDVRDRDESGLMPDWHRRKTDERDDIDWQPLVERGYAREPALRAAHAEEGGTSSGGAIVGVGFR